MVMQEKSSLVQMKNVEAKYSADILLGLQSSTPPSLGNERSRLAIDVHSWVGSIMDHSLDGFGEIVLGNTIDAMGGSSEMSTVKFIDV